MLKHQTSNIKHQTLLCVLFLATSCKITSPSLLDAANPNATYPTSRQGQAFPMNSSPWVPPNGHLYYIDNYTNQEITVAFNNHNQYANGPQIYGSIPPSSRWQAACQENDGSSVCAWDWYFPAGRYDIHDIEVLGNLAQTLCIAQEGQESGVSYALLDEPAICNDGTNSLCDDGSPVDCHNQADSTPSCSDGSAPLCDRNIYEPKCKMGTTNDLVYASTTSGDYYNGKYSVNFDPSNGTWPSANTALVNTRSDTQGSFASALPYGPVTSLIQIYPSNKPNGNGCYIKLTRSPGTSGTRSCSVTNSSNSNIGSYTVTSNSGTGECTCNELGNPWGNNCNSSDNPAADEAAAAIKEIGLCLLAAVGSSTC